MKQEYILFNDMMKIKAFLGLMALTTVTATAQTDVTKYYLTNYGFDSDYDYVAGATNKVAQEIKDIKGWTANLSADYTVTGIYEFGFAGTFNNASLPAKGYDNEEGGALALSTGWEQTFCYYQSVTLPAGTYTINVPTYNGKTATGGTSQLAWIPSSGSAVTSTLSSYPAKQWTLDQITFTLARQTAGKIQIGYKAAAGPSSSSANLVIDYVQVIAKDMTVNKSNLRSTIASANRLYGTGEGTGADKLKAAIDAAQLVYDNAEATMPEVLEANYQLQQAMEDYQLANVSEDNPIDVTSDYIQSPSFEESTGGINGWTVANLQRQSNSYFSRKNGTYYMETWVDRGSRIADARVCQTLSNLPRGNYRLTAAALHIQQTGSNSTTNKGDAQTGAFLYAGHAKEEVTAMKLYTLSFAVLEEKADVEIGLKAEDATGNWLCVDNFKLEYVGQVTSDSYVREVQTLVQAGQELLSQGVQATVAETMNTAIAAATTALAGTGTDGSGNTLYDTEALAEAKTMLTQAIAAAEASRARYDALQARIDYAEKVAGWWEGVARKATTLTNLKVAIETAREQLTDYTLTDSQLTTATNTLNSRISAVDKKIYCSTNACGTDAQLKVATNQWCYERSMQSKHWVIFWEKGYGDTAPAAVPSILDNADKIFELYADSLKFITINQGKSKTDTYKMIIRLRYTTDWEASGSGIDDQIGLLTLSNGAHTSRSGQTVAHEIGHCFQYQTHCDNGNQNGWMYNWGNSTLNVFWEMCAQWQAYKYYPNMQFNNEWLNNSLNNLHKHPLCREFRYENFFIQDYFCHRHGMDIIALLWNKSQRPEDPLQAYMRLTMSGTTAAKLDQLGDEMWEYGARMTTFDMDPIRDYGKSTINKRTQTALTKDSEDYWWPTASNCIENFGNNAIRLNVPKNEETVYVEFIGEAGADGYTAYRTTNAGWKFGFVALQKDGTRVYGDINTATAKDPQHAIAFECPANCSYLWLVVSGAPTAYWTRDWTGWEESSTAEQWPYRVRFYKTNVYGKTNPTDEIIPDGIADLAANRTAEGLDASHDSHRATDENVYSLTGQIVRRGTTSLNGLPSGIYIVRGRKVMK